MDWEWMSDSEEITFAIKGLPRMEYDAVSNRWVKKDNDPVDVLYRWACNTEGMNLYRLGIFRGVRVISLECTPLLPVPDADSLMKVIGR